MPEGWKIKESTILEYVYCLLDVGVYDGGIIFCCMKALLRQNDKENAQRLQEQAINKKVFINYDSYCMLKKLGAVIPKPYLFVEHYPIKMIYIFPLHAHKSTGTMSSAAWPTTEQTKNWCFRIL